MRVGKCTKSWIIGLMLLCLLTISAQAHVTVTTVTQSNPTQLDTTDDLIYGKLFDSVVNTKSGSEKCDTTGRVLTDGIAVCNSPYGDHLYSIGPKTVFVYSLGDNSEGYDITSLYFGFGWGDTGRCIGEVDKVRYATADAPDVWIDSDIAPTTGITKSNNAIVFELNGGSVILGAVKLEVSVSGNQNGFVGMSELMIIGKEHEQSPFFELDDYAFTNAVTGSKTFVNTLTPNIVELPVETGIDHWQPSESAELEAVRADGWTDEKPTSQTFVDTGLDRNLIGYMWFTNMANSAYVKRLAKSAAIRYTTAKPTVVVKDLASEIFVGRSATLSVPLVDNGIVGGTSMAEGIDAMQIPVYSHAFEILTGPGSDLDDRPDTLTVDQVGSYAVRLTVMNEAGNVESAELVWTVAQVEKGVVTWVGGVSSDFMREDNWSPAIVPTDGDDVLIPAAATRQIQIPAVDLPASGAFRSFTVESGATAICLGDTTCINEEAGGTAKVPYGRGPVLRSASFVIAGHLSADDQGFGAGPGAALNSAAHGGLGNCRTFLSSVLTTAGYGRADAPTELGSGHSGTRGGGAIKMVATGDIVLDGSVTADTSGYGSGGSVWLVAGGTFSGVGSVSASSKPVSSEGGGGRIRIDYETSTFTGTVSARTGSNLNANIGSAGTLYEAKRYPIGTEEDPVDLTISDEFAYIFPDDGKTRHWNLTVGNTPHLEFHDGRLVLHSLVVGNQSLVSFAQWSNKSAPEMKYMDVRSLTLSDRAFVQLAGAAAMPKFELDDLMVPVGTTLAFGRGDGSYVNEDAGGTASIPLGRGTEVVCGNATIAGTLSVSQMGFGPGFNNDTQDHGTAHGGATPGTTIWKKGYGHFTRPIELGGNFAASGIRYGGGAVKLRVKGTLDLSGTISADAELASRGSGGSVWIQAATLTGAGTVSALPGTEARYGGGGRIAIETVDASGFTGTTRVDIGMSPNDNASFPGTVFWNTVPNVKAFGWDGTSFKSSYEKEVCNSSIMTYSAENYGDQAFELTREVTAWSKTNFAWKENFSLRKTGEKIANRATYVIAGLHPGRKAKVLFNGETINGDNGSPLRVANDGTLTFSADLVAGENVISVSVGSGLIFVMR